ncbi:hypothetical protein N0M98_11280 [Paenibacillus doosanensis]|uniref:hypothetical protein n=1 Tax=Paenibacillus doosanensis TaxID=1229154 RepID=UPI00217F418B|nr:hypothetical protein [Paenibacillus doosanensis]MCS7460726.1 hypothetical protein [Paenibacillus doosanensis]
MKPLPYCITAGLRRFCRLALHQSFLLCILCVLLVASSAACGSKNKGAEGSGKPKAQSNEQKKPVDNALREQMNMYKQLKQHEYEESEKLRKADKEQLKKIQKSRQQKSGGGSSGTGSSGSGGQSGSSGGGNSQGGSK